MNIVDFTEAHTEQAMRLAQAAYEEERAHVPALPEMQVPGLRGLAKINLGVAAFEGNEMVGFLCACGPFRKAFGTTPVRGVWSPVHNHAAVGDRARVYHRMYQAVAKKWVNAGALSHAVTLYAHDEAAKQAWFTYGFGMRCIDAIKLIEPGDVSGDFFELPRERAGELQGLLNALIDHLGLPPCFLHYGRKVRAQAAKSFTEPNVRIFAARREGKLVAYIKIGESGESFASRAILFSSPGVINRPSYFLIPICISLSCFSVTSPGAPSSTSCALLLSGNAITSRIVSSPAISITILSMPGAMPA